MRRKGVYGRIFAIILAATMALGTAPEAALMVQAEGIESEQINEEGEGGSEDENQPGGGETSEEASEDEDAAGEESENAEEETNDTSAAYETPEYYGLNVESGVITGFKTDQDKAEVCIYIDTWNVSKIADGAFQNNTTLERLYIYIDRFGDVPPFEIGDNAFKGCTNLEYLSTVSIDKIGTHAFDGTKLGASGTLNIQAKKIGAYAFANITGAGSNFEVTFAPSVNEIGDGAFDGTKLAKVTFTGNVATIGHYSSDNGNGPFAGAIGLTTAEFAYGVSYIPNNILKGSPITKVTIPSSITRIEEYAFANCSNLTSVSLPSNLTYIGKKAFCESGLTGTVTIPDSVTEIGMEAFENDANLTGVNLSANLQKIGASAFKDTKLTSIIIPASVTTIGTPADHEDGNGPFAGATNLTTAVFADGRTSIPANIFKGSSVTTVTIPNSVTRIEKYAFSNCSNLASVNLPSNLTYIGKKAFCESGLTGTVTIPDNVTEIGDEAFYNIATLTGVQLSAGLQTIGSGAFAKTGLTSVTIPKDVKTVGRYSSQDGNGPFWGASSLTTAVFEDGISSIPNNIFKGSSVTTVTIPSSVQRIEEYAFTDCTNLTTVTLPSGLTYIGRKAFYGSGLTGTINIPFAVTEIVDYAFGNCTYLEFVEFGTKVTKLGSGIWDGCSSIKLKVIQGTTTETTLKNKGYGSLILYYNGPEYSINYDLNGGTNSSANPDKYYWAFALTLKNPTKPGYTFKGWYTSNTYMTKVTTIPKGSTGDKTFYANWTANKYTVMFNANGGTGTTTSMSCNYDETYNLRANKCSRKGYTFVGWTCAKNGTGYVYSDCEAISNLTTKSKGTVTLYAKWEKIDYTITYNNCGGATNTNLGTYTVTDTLKLKNAYKEGFTFNGWYEDAKLKKKVTEISKGTTGNKTFYAKFTGNKYFVTFNVKRMSETMSGTYYDGVKLPRVDSSCNPGDGTTFAGWNTKADGTGTHYDAGDSMAVFAKPGKKATKIELYAEWQ